METQEIFLGIAEAGVAMRNSNDQLNRSFAAVSQIIGKGSVQMEELRQQLGEQLPPAIGLFAKALNVSTEEFFEMVGNGEVGVQELLRFTRLLRKEFSDDLTVAITRASSEINRLRNDSAKLAERIGQGGLLDGVKEVASAFRDLFKELSGTSAPEDIGDQFRQLGIVFGDFIRTQGPGTVEAFQQIISVVKDNFIPSIQTAGKTFSDTWLLANKDFNDFVADIAEGAGQVVSVIDGITKAVDQVAPKLSDIKVPQLLPTGDQAPRLGLLFDTAGEKARNLSKDLGQIQKDLIAIKVAAEQQSASFAARFRDNEKALKGTNEELGKTKKGIDEVKNATATLGPAIDDLKTDFGNLSRDIKPIPGEMKELTAQVTGEVIENGRRVLRIVGESAREEQDRLSPRPPMTHP